MDIKRFRIESVFVILALFIVQTLIAGEIFEDDDEENGNWNRCPWIRNKLKNGRVKIRSRGRIAKFLCEPGYELAGKRFATCVRGQWNNPLPVCVSRGCHRPPHVDNARVTMMYRGAVLTYDCLPGYTLEGGASIYCDGRRWSGDPPACVVPASDPATSCDFEDPDLCGWSQDPTHEFDWKRNQFATPSGHVGTGPSYDHTFGEGKGGFYLFMEASSPRAVNDTARLFSPVYPDYYGGGCFVFWYHMFGSTTGGLRVYFRPESHVFGELPPVWSLYGDQGNQWFRGNISIPQSAENFQIVIEGIRGSSYIGDTAIDDISLHDGDCESLGNSTENASETVSNSCRGRCRESSNSTACGCNDDCVALHNCCDDFDLICTKNTEAETDETNKDKTTVGATFATSEASPETELAEVKNTASVPPSETGGHSVIDETTPMYPETTTILVKNVSQPIILSTTSTEKTTSLTTYGSTSTSTAATTAKTTTTKTPIIPSSTSTTTSTTQTTPSTTTITPSTTTTSTSTTTTSPATTTTTTGSTTTRTTSKSPLPKTTPLTTSTTSTTIPSTTTMKITTSPIPSSSPSSSMKPPIIITLSASSTTKTNSATSMSTSTEGPSTRRIYNLRPRNRTTISLDTQPTSPTTIRAPIYRTTTPVKITSTPKTPPPTITTRSTTTTRSQINAITWLPTVNSSSQESIKKFTVHYEKSTDRSVMDTDAHASKTESVSNAGAPVVTIVSVIIVILVCAIVGALFFIRRWQAQKLSKLGDDSEMKFLSENEYVEYSESSALDRINFNP